MMATLNAGTRGSFMKPIRPTASQLGVDFGEEEERKEAACTPGRLGRSSHVGSTEQALGSEERRQGLSAIYNT